MVDIEKLLASLEGPTQWKGIDLENNVMEDEMAERLYKFFVRYGNAAFDTYGMHEDIEGIKLLNCLLIHFTEKEDYRKCKWVKKRKEELIRLMCYFDRCRMEKIKRVKKKRNVR